MRLKLASKQVSTPAPPVSQGSFPLGSWVLRLRLFAANTWEVSLILLVAGFLRFYQINTTEFDEDQAMLFRLASDAVHHGLLPTTSNAASIGIANPPGVIYLLIPLAALSANPLWGAVLVGVFTTATALLTYLFTRRYYGRLAGVVAALLYASTAMPLNYARFLWQPNLMPPFVVLFLFALFWGVVERRKGWLVPALFLFGILYQMHPTTLLLAVPLLTAAMLAPGTMRWRDLALAFALLLVIFFPYLLWEVFTGFADLHTVFLLAKQPAHLDTKALHQYRIFLSPFETPPTTTQSVVRLLAPLLSWLSVAVPLLTLAGLVTAAVWSLPSWQDPTPDLPAAPPSSPDGLEASTNTPPLASPAGQKEVIAPQRSGARGWWTRLRADPSRCGFLLLLVWQTVPLLLLSRHAIELQAQYFLMFLPGPFILIGLFLAKTVAWSQGHAGQGTMVRYGMYTLVGLVLIAQLVGSTAAVLDGSRGYFDDRGFPPYPYHNDLRSLQDALNEADQLAQQRHLNRVYITTDLATQAALRYLAEQMQTPTTLFDAFRCLVLPNPVDGPAVLLVGPYDGLTNALLSQFAAATLIDSPRRLGGAPFRLYVVTPAAAPSATQSTFTGNLQLLDSQAHQLRFNGIAWLITRWNLMQAEPLRFRTTYGYVMMGLPNGSRKQSKQSRCIFTAIRAGDQLVVAFNLPKGSMAPTSVTIKAQSFSTTPPNPTYGPFHLETSTNLSTPWRALQTPDGSTSITIPTA